MFLQLVTVLPLATQQATIDDVRVLAIMRDRHVYLAQIDTGDLLTCGGRMRLYLVGRNGFVLGARPVDDDRLREFPWPIQDERFIATPIRESQFPICEFHGTPLVLDFEVPLASPGWMCIGIAQLFALPPGFERG